MAANGGHKDVQVLFRLTKKQIALAKDEVIHDAVQREIKHVVAREYGVSLPTSLRKELHNAIDELAQMAVEYGVPLDAKDIEEFRVHTLEEFDSNDEGWIGAYRDLGVIEYVSQALAKKFDESCEELLDGIIPDGYTGLAGRIEFMDFRDCCSEWIDEVLPFALAVTSDGALHIADGISRRELTVHVVPDKAARYFEEKADAQGLINGKSWQTVCVCEAKKRGREFDYRPLLLDRMLGSKGKKKGGEDIDLGLSAVGERARDGSDYLAEELRKQLAMQRDGY